MIDRIAILGQACWAHRRAWRCARRDFTARSSAGIAAAAGARPRSDGRNRLIAADPIAAAQQARSCFSPFPSTPRSTGWSSSRRCLVPTISSPTSAAPRPRSPKPPIGCSTHRIARRSSPAIPWPAKNAAAQRLAMPISFAARSGSSPIIRHGGSPQSSALAKDWREWVLAMGSKPSTSTRSVTTNSSPGSATLPQFVPRR